MILELEETKNWLRVDGSQDDMTLTTLIPAAEQYVLNATGKAFDSTNALAKLLCMVLVADWFENRELVGQPSNKVRFTVTSIVAQLQHCEIPPDPPAEGGEEP